MGKRKKKKPKNKPAQGCCRGHVFLSSAQKQVNIRHTDVGPAADSMELAVSSLAVPCGLEASKRVGVRSGQEAKFGEGRADPKWCQVCT